jgi:hypothetical protein
VSGLSLDSLDGGALAHKPVDSSRPKDMQWVSGLVGAVVDCECGNELGAAAQAASALEDLKDIPQSPSTGKPAANGAPSSTKPSTSDTSSSGKAAAAASSTPQWTYEPSPPPFLATTTTTTTSPAPASAPPASAPRTLLTPTNPLDPMAFLARLTSKLQASGGATPAPAGGSKPATGPAQESKSGPGHFLGTTSPPASAPPAPSSPKSPPANIYQVASNQAKANAPASKPAPAPSSPGGAPPAASTTTATTTTTTTAPGGQAPATGPASESKSGAGHFLSSSGAESSSKSSSVDPSTLSKDNFMKLSDDDLMKAVRDGKVPSEVTDSNEGMLELQARMNHISEMNQMMTTMMQSMHQVKMSVIENLKV